MANNGVIGKNNQLLWHLPNDLKHFKALTLGKPIIMGRKTYESIGKLLPGRHNILLTQNKSFQVDGATIVHSVAEALLAAGSAPEVMIIGGAEIYRLFYPEASCLYLTIVDTLLNGDATFSFDVNAWQETSRQDFLKDEQHPYNYSFITLTRGV